jgi:hypothetical protein
MRKILRRIFVSLGFLWPHDSSSTATVSWITATIHRAKFRTEIHRPARSLPIILLLAISRIPGYS